MLENNSYKMPNESQDLITKAELAARLCRTTRTIDMWVTEGILPDPLKIRRSVYFYWSEVLIYLDRYLGPRGPHRQLGRKPPRSRPRKKKRSAEQGPAAPDQAKTPPGSSAPADSSKKKQDGDDPAPPQEGGDNEEKP